MEELEIRAPIWSDRRSAPKRRGALSPGTGIGAGVDSFYEYLVKAALYEDDPVLLERGLNGCRRGASKRPVRDASQ